MSVPFIPTRNSTAGSTAAPTTSQLTTLGQCAINTYTGSFYMRKEDNTISEIVGDRLSGFRNRLINGNMAIDQRNAGTSVTANNDVFPVDRFQVIATQTSKLTAQQNAGAVTPPVGFSKYLGFTSSSAYSVLSTDIFTVRQKIEGFNMADLGWGAAGAQPVTLSFWVRSSLTGTFAGALENSGINRCYVFSYSISAANTWEQKSITIAGDTTGTWLTDSGIGISLSFALGVGSSSSGTAGAWGATRLFSATGATSVVGTNGATFYVTGVQLEKGLVPTPFEVRSYGTELALCQRYACSNFPTGTKWSQNSGAQSGLELISVVTNAIQSVLFYYPVTMRSNPSVITSYSPTAASADWSTNTFTPTFQLGGSDTRSCSARTTGTYGPGYSFLIFISVTSEL